MLRSVALAALAVACACACAAPPPANMAARATETGFARLAVAGAPREIHNSIDGWAESPALAASPERIWVAYEVSEGQRSQIWLATLPRGIAGADASGLNRLRIDLDGYIESRPSVAVVDGRGDAGGVWVAWTSFKEGAWAVRACRVRDAARDAEIPITLSEPGGLESWVRVKSGQGVVCFVWTAWDGSTCRILARAYDGGLGPIVTVYQGRNPVGRPDVHIVARNRLLFVWDEYIDGRFAIRSREIADGRLAAVRTLETGGDCYEPRLAGSGDDFLATWHWVPADSTTCVPAAAIGGDGPLGLGLGRYETEDTWRVRSIWDAGGAGWLVWATRAFFRNTPLFVRRLTGDPPGPTVRIDFPLLRNFMNTFDCLMDRDFVVTWDHSGSVYLAEIGIHDIASARGDARGGSTGRGSGRSDALSERAAGGLAADSSGDRAFSSDWDERYGGEVRRTSATGAARRKGAGRAILYEGDSLRVYFGDYHNHTSFSDGRAYPDISLAIARDRRNLDFAGISDHDVTLTPSEYAWTKAIADLVSDDGRFATLHGFEPSKGWAQGGFGHWNAIFAGEGEVLHYEPGMTPADLYGFARGHDALMVPHHVAKRFAPHNWDYNDPEVERVVEVCSLHGIFERRPEGVLTPDLVDSAFVEDGLARGYVFGLVGGSDSHNCFEAAQVDQGLTGVYARDLSRAAVVDAMRRRRAFALTGGNIVVDFRCNGKLMGEEITVGPGEGSLTFSGGVWSVDPIVSVEIVSAGRVVYRSEPAEGGVGPEARFTWTAAVPDSRAYYYLRATTAGGDLAWSSPIWIIPQR
jgi:hypothetical protein